MKVRLFFKHFFKQTRIRIYLSGMSLLGILAYSNNSPVWLYIELLCCIGVVILVEFILYRKYYI